MAPHAGPACEDGGCTPRIQRGPGQSLSSLVAVGSLSSLSDCLFSRLPRVRRREVKSSIRTTGGTGWWQIEST